VSAGRRLAGIGGWLLALSGAVVALQLSGRGALAAPPLTDPGSWPAWVAGRDPVMAAFALVRLAAVAAAWYLVAVTAVGIVLRTCGAVGMVTAADLVTVAPVRRMLAGTMSLGLAASGAMGIIGPASRLTVAAAAQATQSPAPAATPGTVTMHQLTPAAPDPPAPAAASPQAAADHPGDRWTVAPGQCFWSIAESVLTAHLGRLPSDAEIVPYWRGLIDANRDELAQRDNPDLVFPGQTFAVPAP
jgi:nucleoid-associated protein YgaU